MLNGLKIDGKFTTGIFKFVAEKVIKKKTGFDTKIQLNALRLLSNEEDETVTIELDIKGTMKQEDFKKLIENLEL